MPLTDEIFDEPTPAPRPTNDPLANLRKQAEARLAEVNEELIEARAYRAKMQEKVRLLTDEQRRLSRVVSSFEPRKARTGK